MVGLRVGQAFGVFLLLGLGVGSSSPQVLRHPVQPPCATQVLIIQGQWILTLKKELIHRITKI